MSKKGGKIPEEQTARHLMDQMRMIGAKDSDIREALLKKGFSKGRMTQIDRNYRKTRKESRMQLKDGERITAMKERLLEKQFKDGEKRMKAMKEQFEEAKMMKKSKKAEAAKRRSKFSKADKSEDAECQAFWDSMPEESDDMLMAELFCAAGDEELQALEAQRLIEELFGKEEEEKTKEVNADEALLGD